MQRASVTKKVHKMSHGRLLSITICRTNAWDTRTPEGPLKWLKHAWVRYPTTGGNKVLPTTEQCLLAPSLLALHGAVTISDPKSQVLTPRDPQEALPYPAEMVLLVLPPWTQHCTPTHPLIPPHTWGFVGGGGLNCFRGSPSVRPKKLSPELRFWAGSRVKT